MLTKYQSMTQTSLFFMSFEHLTCPTQTLTQIEILSQRETRPFVFLPGPKTKANAINESYFMSLCLPVNNSAKKYLQFQLGLPTCTRFGWKNWAENSVRNCT